MFENLRLTNNVISFEQLCPGAVNSAPKGVLGTCLVLCITKSAITPGKHQIPFYLEIKVFLNIYKPKYNNAIGLIYKKYLCKIFALN